MIVIYVRYSPPAQKKEKRKRKKKKEKPLHFFLLNKGRSLGSLLLVSKSSELLRHNFDLPQYSFVSLEEKLYYNGNKMAPSFLVKSQLFTMSQRHLPLLWFSMIKSWPHFPSPASPSASHTNTPGRLRLWRGNFLCWIFLLFLGVPCSLSNSWPHSLFLSRLTPYEFIDFPLKETSHLVSLSLNQASWILCTLPSLL